MNISYKWLKEYVDFDLTPQQVCDALTSTGLEVDALEEVQSIKGGLKGLYVGKVLTCEMHPDSDHLHVTTVDLGKGEPQQIVCGAPNVAAGQKVIVADLGCVLYDGDKEFVIKKSKLRGVVADKILARHATPVTAVFTVFGVVAEHDVMSFRNLHFGGIACEMDGGFGHVGIAMISARFGIDSFESFGVVSVKKTEIRFLFRFDVKLSVNDL